MLAVSAGCYVWVATVVLCSWAHATVERSKWGFFLSALLLLWSQATGRIITDQRGRHRTHKYQFCTTAASHRSSSGAHHWPLDCSTITEGKSEHPKKSLSTAASKSITLRRPLVGSRMKGRTTGSTKNLEFKVLSQILVHPFQFVQAQVVLRAISVAPLLSFLLSPKSTRIRVVPTPSLRFRQIYFRVDTTNTHRLGRTPKAERQAVNITKKNNQHPCRTRAHNQHPCDA